MVKDFGIKLRLTAALLGCTSQKDLCARFHAVNPATAFDLDRSYKWMQGRALPRSRRIYEDWAALLEAEVPLARLQSCTAREFVGLICTRHALSADVLLARAGLDDLAPAPRDQPAALPCPQLAGDYACYSPAWSLYFQGRIIRGSLAVRPDESSEGMPGLLATYAEEVSIGAWEVGGPAVVIGRSVWLDLVDREGQNRLVMCLLMPGALASVLSGVMAGASLVDTEPRPAACRIVLARVPPEHGAHLHRSNRYIDPTRERLADDLAALGLGGARREVDGLLERFLAGGRSLPHLKVSAEEQAVLARAFDRLLIGDGLTAAE